MDGLEELLDLEDRAALGVEDLDVERQACGGVARVGGLEELELVLLVGQGDDDLHAREFCKTRATSVFGPESPVPCGERLL